MKHCEVMELNRIVRKNILALEPYSSARGEFEGYASIYLDANESPFNNPYNRYPDPLQRELKMRISELKGVGVENIFLGVGSDECIDLAFRVFCEPRKDNVVAIAPTYGMYKVCADINDVEYRPVMLDEHFKPDFSRLLAAVDDNTKVIWICSPNNPTGNAFDREKLSDLCHRFEGIVIIDEAYVDFSDKGSMLEFLDRLPNLIVLQTFSKAMASASVRLGMAFASKEIVDLYNKVKYPYNINMLTQQYALSLLSKDGKIRGDAELVVGNRKSLSHELAKLKCVEKVFPSDANFLLVRVDDADRMYKYLLGEGIVVRNRNRVTGCEGCLRFTVGTEEENDMLINGLKKYENLYY